MNEPSKDVFINCPFDDDFRDLFRAIVFSLVAVGFRPRCSLERNDAGEVRLGKITAIIRQCRLAVHDISRIELDRDHQLPRFNMPFELGLWLGFHQSSRWRKVRAVSTIIFEAQPYQYQKYLSDIAGQDIRSHDGLPDRLIVHLRDWLKTTHPELRFPGGLALATSFTEFRHDLPELAHEVGLNAEELAFIDLVEMITDWLARSAPATSNAKRKV